MGQVTKCQIRLKVRVLGRKYDFFTGRTVERKRERSKEPSASFNDLQSFIGQNLLNQE